MLFPVRMQKKKVAHDFRYVRRTFKMYPVRVISKFGVKNFRYLTGMSLHRSTLKHDRGRNYMDTYLFLIYLTTLLVPEYVWCI